jgi:hypothetical protein
MASHKENCSASLISCWMNSVRCFRFFLGLSRSRLSPLLRPEALRWVGPGRNGLALMGWKRHWGPDMGVRPQRRGIEAAEAIFDLWVRRESFAEMISNASGR